MLAEALIVGSFALAALATVWLFRILRHNRRQRRAPAGRIDERLAESHSTTRIHLERPPRLRALPTVDRTGDGEPVVVPVIRVELGMTEPPGMGLAFEYVASVLEAVQPELVDVSVRHYDVQFRFGPDGLLVSRTCFRVSVPPELADRLVTDENYRAHDLRRDVEDGDDGDPETAPVLWADCRSY